MKENTKINLSFAGINPYIESNIVEATENEVRGTGFISWGDDNNYPQYLFSLYKDVTTLQAIVNGCLDYICGDDIKSHVLQLSDKDMKNLIHDIAFSYLIYGGFALNVVRNKLGQVAIVKCLDFRNVRSNKKNDILYYSEDFGKKSYGRGKYTAYPKYGVEDKNASSIFYYKNIHYQTYPLPVYAGAIKACEIEKSIDEYHLNAINNGFMGSVLVSLNNGVPNEEQQAEIEKGFNEKWAGKDNAGRIVISYGTDKEHAATIDKIETEDFSDRYNALAERTKQQIFTAFRCTPNLFGLPTQTTGFSQQEYKEAYALFASTFIRPIQNIIVENINYIFNVENAVEITPFSVNFEDNTNISKTVE